MHAVILWCGFFGAWLLVAGPLYQASSELSERGSGVSREEIAGLVPEPSNEGRPSAWWWLIPPVGFWKQRQFVSRQREEQMAALPHDTMVKFLDYTTTATGWFYVAAGAFLIAVKETWELVEGLEWPAFVFWAAVVVMMLAAAGNAARSASRRHQYQGTG